MHFCIPAMRLAKSLNSKLKTQKEMFHQKQKVQDAYYDQYEMDLAFQQMGTKTEKDGFGTNALKYVEEVKNNLGAI